MKTFINLIKWICICLLFFKNCNSNSFANPYVLQELFIKELQVRTHLEKANIELKSYDITNYLEKHQPVLDELKDVQPPRDPKKVSRLISPISLKKVWELLCAHPVHVFQLVRRLRFFEEKINPLLTSESEYFVPIKNLMKPVVWPTDEDFKGAIHGLLRVQYTYHLDIVALAKGQIGNRNTSAKLFADDCFDLAKERLYGNNPLQITGGVDYAVAIEWAEASLELAEEQNVEDIATIDKIKNLITYAKKQHDERFIPPTPGDGWSTYPNEHFFIRKFNNDFTLTGKKLRQEEWEQFRYRYSSELPMFHHHIRDYHTVCRGEKLIFKNQRAFQGYCELRTNNDAWLMLAPAKTEIMSEGEFPLLLFHNVVSDTEIDYMVKAASKQLERAGLFDGTDGAGTTKTTFTSERTQSNAWLNWDNNSNHLKNIAKRLDRITGLHVHNEDHEIIHSEGFQIGVYAPGGLYLPHYDAFTPLDQYARTRNGTWVGNRIATAMFYLSDLDGGATAFPNQGLATFPSKGSMAFWYNLEPSGRRSESSLHGACPTLYGIKWVSNKWIREGSQVFTRPCTQ